MDDSKLIKHILLKTDEYASVISDFIDEDTAISMTSDKANIIGVFGSPNIGKTTLMNNKVKRSSDWGLHTVIVTPTINLGYMINGELNASKNFDGHKYTKLSERLIISTPDSLADLVEKFERNNIYFEMHVDEVHERIDSSELRTIAFKNVDRAISSNSCICCFMYSGTPDNIINYYNFNKVYNIHKKGKVIKNNPKVITTDSLTQETIKDCIEYAYVNHREKDGQVFVFLNDKVKHNYVEKNLDLDIFNFNTIDKSEVLLISADTKDNDDIKEMIKNKHIPLKYQIILITSSASTGIEFFLDNDATVVVFCNNYTFNINQEIQSTIRVRSSISELLFVKQEYNEVEEFNYVEYKEFFDKRYSKYKDKLNEKVEFWDTAKKIKAFKSGFNEFSKDLLIKAICYNNISVGALEESSAKEEGCSVALIYNEKTDSLEIDEALLHKYIWDEYSTLILRNTDSFIKYMKDKCTQFDFTNQEFEILRYEKIFKDAKLTDAILDILNNNTYDDDEKAKKQNEKELLIDKYRQVLSDYDLNINDKINLIIDNEKCVSSRFLHKELYDAIETLESVDTTFKALKELLKHTLSNNDRKDYYTEYIKGISTNKLNQYKDDELFKFNIITAYSFLDAKESEIKKQPKAVRELIYILKYLQKKDGSYRDVRVTKKLREELYMHLQKLGIYGKDKAFTDTIDKKMFKLLNRMFNLTEVKSENIGKKNKLDKVYKTSSLKNKLNKQINK